MTVYIALLRAVNVAGRNRVGMGDLRVLLEDLRFGDVRTVLQSGNLIFSTRLRKTGVALEKLLEDAAATRLGLATDFLVRTAEEWARIIAGNPFVGQAERDPGHLVVMFLKGAPSRQQASALRKAITGREMVEVKGRHAYIVYPDGIGRSRLTTARIEGNLGTRGTGRNWNTVLKLGSLAGV